MVNTAGKVPAPRELIFGRGDGRKQISKMISERNHCYEENEATAWDGQRRGGHIK